MGKKLLVIGAHSADFIWRAGGTIPDSFKMFTHLVDEAGRLVTQHDGLPTEGKRPTPSWAPGEIITDVHPILIPPDTKPGAFWLRVGLYDPESGSRLPLTGAPIDFQTLTRVVYVRAAP